MKIAKVSGVLLVSATLLGACTTAGGVGPDGQPRLIARDADSGFDPVTLPQQQAAIAYDPDGCQNWIIDDGVEGYASRRRDPVTGLPVCNNQFPPGTVVKEYRSTNFPDILP
jgi:predicted small secreted protein